MIVRSSPPQPWSAIAGSAYRSGQGTIEHAVEAIKLGAQDFLEKPVQPAKLKILLEKLEETRVEQAKAVDALRESVRLAILRYTGGLSTYFEVLEAQQQLFPAENVLAQTDRDRLLAVVQLYAALGGGWEATDKPVPVPFWPTGP